MRTPTHTGPPRVRPALLLLLLAGLTTGCARVNVSGPGGSVRVNAGRGGANVDIRGPMGGGLNVSAGRGGANISLRGPRGGYGIPSPGRRIPAGRTRGMPPGFPGGLPPGMTPDQMLKDPRIRSALQDPRIRARIPPDQLRILDAALASSGGVPGKPAPPKPGDDRGLLPGHPPIPPNPPDPGPAPPQPPPGSGPAPPQTPHDHDGHSGVIMGPPGHMTVIDRVEDILGPGEVDPDAPGGSLPPDRLGPAPGASSSEVPGFEDLEFTLPD